MTLAAPDRHALTWLLATLVAARPPLVLELPAWVVLVFVLAVAWRYLIETRRRYVPGRTLRLVSMVLVTVAVYRQYGTLLGRDPGIALLVVLLGLKLLELRSLRDHLIIVFLSYLVILGGFLYTQNPWIGAWALVAVIVSTLTLMRLQQPEGMPFPLRLRLATGLLAQALPLMLVMYFLFPRFHGALWELPAATHSRTQIGMSEVMQPGSIRQLVESGRIAFRATFTAKPPPARELYWRGLVLWSTDGQAWRRDREPAEAAASFTPLGDPLDYTVTLEASGKPWLFALDLPGSAPPGAHFRPGFTLEHSKPIHERYTYALTSYPLYRTGALTPDEREATLELPEKISARVRALAESWRAPGRDPRETAQAALDYFRRENFVYTLSPPLLGEDPVDEFLFRTRRGFCEHYAAAFVTLMRAAGIPSRVVAGYLGGEYNAAGNYFIVRQADAHAWAEFWHPREGWLRADPTSVVAPERIEFGAAAVRSLESQGVALGRLSAAAVQQALETGWLDRGWRRTRLYWDTLNLAWYQWVEDYTRERQRALLQRLGFERASWTQLTLTLSLGVAALLLAYAVLPRLRRRHRADPALTLYLRLCRKLARAGLARAPYEGPLSFLRRSAERRPELRADLEAVTGLYVALRYGRAPGAEMLREFRARVGRFRARTVRAGGG